MSKVNHEIKVTKSIKIQAGMAKVRGGNYRQVIRALGEAEYIAHKFGRLVLGTKNREG